MYLLNQAKHALVLSQSIELSYWSSEKWKYGRKRKMKLLFHMILLLIYFISLFFKVVQFQGCNKVAYDKKKKCEVKNEY